MAVRGSIKLATAWAEGDRSEAYRDGTSATGNITRLLRGNRETHSLQGIVR